MYRTNDILCCFYVKLYFVLRKYVIKIVNMDKSGEGRKTMRGVLMEDGSGCGQWCVKCSEKRTYLPCYFYCRSCPWTASSLTKKFKLISIKRAKKPNGCIREKEYEYSCFSRRQQYREGSLHCVRTGHLHSAAQKKSQSGTGRRVFWKRKLGKGNVPPDLRYRCRD